MCLDVLTLVLVCNNETLASRVFIHKFTIGPMSTTRWLSNVMTTKQPSSIESYPLCSRCTYKHNIHQIYTLCVMMVWIIFTLNPQNYFFMFGGRGDNVNTNKLLHDTHEM